jgi:hypothetical protein
MPEYENDELDYMHPEGKPEERTIEDVTERADAQPDLRDQRYALLDADGHSLKKRDTFLGEEAAMQPKPDEPDQLKP